MMSLKYTNIQRKNGDYERAEDLVLVAHVHKPVRYVHRQLKDMTGPLTGGALVF